MKGPDEENPLQLSAYHEAARAVACYLLHKGFRYVTIKPGEEKLGKIDYPEKMSKSIPSGKELATIRREYVVALAGPVAKGIVSERCEFEDILPLMCLPSNSTEDNRKPDLVFWKMVFIETKLLLYAPRNWQAVMALTAELLKQETILCLTAREVIKQAIEDYDTGVRDDISALHHSRYREFVKEVTDAKTRFRQSMAASKWSASAKPRRDRQ